MCYRDIRAFLALTRRNVRYLTFALFYTESIKEAWDLTWAWFTKYCSVYNTTSKGLAFVGNLQPESPR